LGWNRGRKTGGREERKVQFWPGRPHGKGAETGFLSAPASGASQKKKKKKAPPYYVRGKERKKKDTDDVRPNPGKKGSDTDDVLRDRQEKKAIDRGPAAPAV